MPTPIIIGVGDVKNSSLRVENAVEPLYLMLQACDKSLKDTELPYDAATKLRASIDSVSTVKPWTWLYEDLPGLFSTKASINPPHQFSSGHGGENPARLFDEAAKRIALGQSKVAIITGGEALASLSACAKAGRSPSGWTTLGDGPGSTFAHAGKSIGEFIKAESRKGAPVHVYPLYENGLRAHRDQSILENSQESAALYAEFSRVAERNPLAWSYGTPTRTAEDISTVSNKNRKVTVPYPLLMNPQNNVNLAAAIILTSTEYAEELGVPREKWIYALGGAGTRDSDLFYERPNFHSSPAISQSLDCGLAAAGLKNDDIDLFDFYSCYPIVPKLAANHLGLPMNGLRKPITLLGGLTFFGGAGNNYSMHAITEMTRQLRQGKGRNGLILANGGVLTAQYVICLSCHPRPEGSLYPCEDPLPKTLTYDDAPVLEKRADGDAIIETYTVEFDRDGRPSSTLIVGRLKTNGHRFIASHGDDSTLVKLCSQVEEPIGQLGKVRPNAQEGGCNLFVFTNDSKL
ncbi:putative acetylacetyltransferase [Phaeomoniella chlamydospora]|uniref:Putative acetylacetyltransferase n=1 Tax=Phaeomoniella chlamydospora TaxID=158046 RepID=A0A0G2GXZ6_PHACM|nr:putative acetylacetyltransferase [Phaeomoniella chlamydospora]